MEQFLNPVEVKAYEQLKKIDHDSIWGIAIKDVIKGNNPESFKELIRNLKSQANDNNKMMRNILGNAYESVITLNSEIPNNLPNEIGAQGSGYCPECQEVTQQTLELYNPDDPTGLKVWQCNLCNAQTEVV